MAELLVSPEPEDVIEPGADDDRYWSVTTIIGALDKPALVPWAALETAKAAVHDEKAWRSRLLHEGPDSAVDYLKSARFRRAKGQRSATEVGTEVHRLCETYVLSGERPRMVDAELRPYLDQFDRFLQEFTPEYRAVECAVYSDRYRYAGQCDGIVVIEGKRLILDYKTSATGYDSQQRPKSPYPEVALQLAAYRHADFAAIWRPRRFERFKRRYYLLSDEERRAGVPVPEVDGGVAVFLSPDRYAVHPVVCDAEVFRRFLFVMEAAVFPFQVARTVVLPPMMPPHPLPLPAGDPFEGLPA